VSKPVLEWEADKHAAAFKAMREAFPDTDPEDPFFTGSLEGLSDFYECIDAKVEQIHRDSAEIAGLQKMIDDYVSKKNEAIARAKARVDTIRTRLLMVMQQTGETKIKRNGYTLSVTANSKPRVLLLDESKLPDDYRRKGPPNLTLIAEALNDPERRAEVQDAATFANKNETLTLR